MTSDTPSKCDFKKTTVDVIAELQRDLAAANEQVEMVEDIQELLGVKSWHGCYAAIAELKEQLAALQAKPDVAGLVEKLDELGFGSTPRHHTCQQASAALLSLSAQLAEKEAECEGLREKTRVEGGLIASKLATLKRLDSNHRLPACTIIADIERIAAAIAAREKP